MGLTITVRRGRAPDGTFPEQAELVRGCRSRLGLSQVRLAVLLCRSVDSVADWERGRARVPGTVRQRLVELVAWRESGVRPEWADPFGAG